MKLEQAARSALEALREYRDTQMIQAPRKAITALREALAEQATVSDGLCGGCAKKAADGWALYCVECWEKAEQEPVGNISLWHNHGYQNHNVEYYGTLPDGLHQLYAAPVRTKDLTDDEVMQTYTNFNLNELSEQSFMIGFARAVIAKDREKNK